ncbi:MAG: 4Fe-4S binding protein [Clostridiales bacterium]|nr:4Fe-4S binding protein [Clostridiales bacterium]
MAKAYENAKNIGAADIIEKISETGLPEFGVDRTAVADKWNTVNAEREFQANPIRVVAGLNNSDANGALLAILKNDPEKIFTGMRIAALSVNAEEMYLFIPEKEAAYAEEIRDKAAGYGIEVKTGIVNVRESRGGAFHHYETLAAIADIFEECYEPGTCMAVCKDGKTGEIRKIPYGTKVADIISGIADIPDADAVTEAYKAVAIGTRLYDVTTALNLVIDEDTQIGNGVITLYGKNCCMIREAEQVLATEMNQSCGKCTFCREGLIQLHTMTKEITLGQGRKEFPDLMTEIGEAMVFSTPCSMGQTASDFPLGTLKYFGNEYGDHIRKKKCTPGVCHAFMSIYIDPDECQGCGDCADICPKDAIEGKDGYIHMIDEFDCDKCGKCLEVCENDAIIQTAGRVPKLPTRLTKVGKFKKRH